MFLYEGRPLRRVFFASTMGMATAAACYPQQAIEKANLSYGKVLSFFTDWKSNSDSEQIHKHVNLSGLPDTVDDEQKPKEKSPAKMKETDLGGEFHVRHILVLKFYDVEIFCFFLLPSYLQFFFHSGIRDSDNFIPGYEYIAGAIIDELSNAALVLFLYFPSFLALSVLDGFLDVAMHTATWEFTSVEKISQKINIIL